MKNRQTKENNQSKKLNFGKIIVFSRKLISDNTLDKLIQAKIPSYFEEHRTISKNDLVQYILKDFPNLKESSINVYLSKLKKEGVLKNPSRGLYALIEKKQYRPAIDVKLKRLFTKIKKAYLE
jgi:hypothetical protein